MKKTIFHCIFTALALCMAASVSAKKDDRTETRLQDAKFTTIESMTAVNVTLVPDTRTYVEVIGNDKELEYTKTKAKGNKLEIYVEIPRKEIQNCYDLNASVKVHYTAIKKIEASSASTITSLSTVKAQKLNIEASSAASIKLDVDVQQLDLETSSAAKIHVTGKATRIDAEASSAANIMIETDNTTNLDAEASSSAKIDVKSASTVKAESSTGAEINILKAFSVDAAANTGGKINIKSTNKLDAKSDMGGTIIYKDHPATIHITTSMGGVVKKR